MASEGSTYGDIHRYEPPRESTAAAVGIVLLTVIQVGLVGLFTYGMLAGKSAVASGRTSTSDRTTSTAPRWPTKPSS